MSDPFVGQLALVGFNFAPTGWASAAGQLLPISRYAALFSLFGTMYGGDGKSTFGLPNLQSNVAIGAGQGPGLSDYVQGESGGATSVTLLSTETPSHTHTMNATTRGGQSTPQNNAFADAGVGNVYLNTGSSLVNMAQQIIPPYGGNQPHNNMMPYLGLNWIVSMQGVFPARG